MTEKGCFCGFCEMRMFDRVRREMEKEMEKSRATMQADMSMYVNKVVDEKVARLETRVLESVEGGLMMT